MIDSKVIKEMAEALKLAYSGTKPYDTTAEVLRIEDGIAWVHIPGGADETPVQMSINARPGDSVRVRVAGGQAWLMGNDSAPPTDDKKANAAQETADEALLKVNTLEASKIIAKLIEAGGINADWINAGSISADRISGGTLKLGGESNANGVLQLYDENNTLVGQWDNTRLNVGENFTIDTNGYARIVQGQIRLGGTNDRWMNIDNGGISEGAGITTFTAQEGQGSYWHGKIRFGSDGFWDVWDNRYHVMYGGSIYPPNDIVMFSGKTVDGVDVSELPCHIITSGTQDLNSYRTEGLYYFSSGATLSNAPNGAVNGWLQVLPSNGSSVKQIWSRHGSNGGTIPTYTDMYERTYSGSTWLDWARLITDAYLSAMPINLEMRSTYDTANPASSASYVPRVKLQDKNGVELAHIGGWVADNATKWGLQLEAERTISGTAKRNTLYLGVDDSGDATVDINGTGAAAAWRSALGVNNSVAAHTQSNNLSLATGTDAVPSGVNSGTLSAGTYLLVAGCAFSSNSSGQRALYFTTNSSGGGAIQQGRIALPANAASRYQVSLLVNVSSNTTYYLGVWQNSGSTLTVSAGYMNIIKLH